jgi:hypothetical protein
MFTLLFLFEYFSNCVLSCWICRHVPPQTGTTVKDASGSGPQLSVDGASSSSGQPSSSFVYNTIAFSNPTDEVAQMKVELDSLQTHLKVTYPPHLFRN